MSKYLKADGTLCCRLQISVKQAHGDKGSLMVDEEGFVFTVPASFEEMAAFSSTLDQFKVAQLSKEQLAAVAKLMEDSDFEKLPDEIGPADRGDEITIVISFAGKDVKAYGMAESDPSLQSMDRKIFENIGIGFQKIITGQF